MVEINVDIEREFKRIARDMRKDPHHRMFSWEHCQEQWKRYSRLRHPQAQDHELMALHLFAYLASWGMLRNSRLGDQTYKSLIPVVKLLLQGASDWDPAPQVDCIFKTPKNGKLKLAQTLFKVGEDLRKKLKSSIGAENEPTDVLVSKILLGTLCCVPAFDYYASKALKSKNVRGLGDVAGLEKLQVLAKKLKPTLRRLQEQFDNELARSNSSYPLTKTLDLYLFLKGKNIVGARSSQVR